MRNEDKNLKHSYEKKKRLFISIDVQKLPLLGSLRHPIDNAASTSSFSSAEAFPSVS